LNTLRWYYHRFIDLFGEDKSPFLLDCAIMFQGILQHNLLYNRMAYQTGEKISQVVRFSVGRLVKMVEDVSVSGDQLLKPELLEKWLPNCSTNDQGFKTQLLHLIGTLRKTISKTIQLEADQEKYIELLDFIQDEFLHSRTPRKFLIESALASLNSQTVWKKELLQLGQFIDEYYNHLEKVD
jgi:hypothetical protein